MKLLVIRAGLLSPILGLVVNRVVMSEPAGDVSSDAMRNRRAVAAVVDLLHLQQPISLGAESETGPRFIQQIEEVVGAARAPAAHVLHQRERIVVTVIVEVHEQS